MRDRGRDGKQRQRDRKQCRGKEERGREEAAATLHIFRL